MTKMKSLLDTASDDFRANDVSYREKVDELHALRLSQRVGGPEMARKRHVDKGKILPRERIERLIDPGTPFLELGELAGLHMHKGVPPGAGIITGIGVIEGRQCMIIANDATVKGGTYFGITCRKHVRAQKIAWKNRLPVITLVDSGGAFLPDQANLFPDEGQFGSIFHQQIGMSGDGVPQIAVVMGPCTAGGAYIPALCDEVVIVRGQGFMYLGGPELTFAATGEKVEAEELGGGKMHSSVSGVTDHLAEDDAHALAITREIVGEGVGRRDDHEALRLRLPHSRREGLVLFLVHQNVGSGVAELVAEDLEAAQRLGIPPGVEQGTVVFRPGKVAVGTGDLVVKDLAAV